MYVETPTVYIKYMQTFVYQLKSRERKVEEEEKTGEKEKTEKKASN